MKTITICQPYAELIVRGEKRVENRTWPTGYRGLLAIHAGKSRDWMCDGDDEVYPGMAFGAIVGVCRLAACLHIDAIEAGRGIDDRFRWLPDHEHTEGPWCWVLEDVRRIEPIAWKGERGLFDVPDEIIAAMTSGGHP